MTSATSLLKRAIHTLNIVLDEMDRAWLPVHKTWRLNERHYGALQGLNKAKAAEEHGEEQVLIWRRSFDVQPPALKPGDPAARTSGDQFRDVPQEDLPYTECLKDTIARAWPYFEQEIEPQMEAGKRVLIASPRQQPPARPRDAARAPHPEEIRRGQHPDRRPALHL